MPEFYPCPRAKRIRGGGASINGENNSNLEISNTDKEGHGTTESPNAQSASGSQPVSVDKTAGNQDTIIESNNLYSAMDNLITISII